VFKDNAGKKVGPWSFIVKWLDDQGRPSVYLMAYGGDQGMLATQMRGFISTVKELDEKVRISGLLPKLYGTWELTRNGEEFDSQPMEQRLYVTLEEYVFPDGKLFADRLTELTATDQPEEQAKVIDRLKNMKKNWNGSN
jgi:hypothetical protein